MSAAFTRPPRQSGESRGAKDPRCEQGHTARAAARRPTARARQEIRLDYRRGLGLLDGQGRPLGYRNVERRALNRAATIAGLDGAAWLRLRFHDLRHTFGTYAIRHNPVADVKEWMGHADLKTTMVYVHYVPQHDAASRLNRAFESEDPTPAAAETSEQTSEQTP